MSQTKMWVYILTNFRKTVLYTGVSNNLVKRIWDHKQGKASKFTAKYKVDLLVYFEEYLDPVTAIEREKQIKAGSRKKKIELIEKMNHGWRDLYEDLLD